MVKSAGTHGWRAWLLLMKCQQSSRGGKCQRGWQLVMKCQWRCSSSYEYSKTRPYLDQRKSELHNQDPWVSFWPERATLIKTISLPGAGKTRTEMHQYSDLILNCSCICVLYPTLNPILVLRMDWQNSQRQVLDASILLRGMTMSQKGDHASTASPQITCAPKI